MNTLLITLGLAQIIIVIASIGDMNVPDYWCPKSVRWFIKHVILWLIGVAVLLIGIP